MNEDNFVKREEWKAMCDEKHGTTQRTLDKIEKKISWFTTTLILVLGGVVVEIVMQALKHN